MISLNHLWTSGMALLIVFCLSPTWTMAEPPEPVEPVVTTPDSLLASAADSEQDLSKKKEKKSPEQRAAAKKRRAAEKAAKAAKAGAAKKPAAEPAMKEETAKESTSEDEAAKRSALLQSEEMREAAAWMEASLSVRANGGQELAEQFKDDLQAMSLEDLYDFLQEYHLVRTSLLQEEQEFHYQRVQTFDRAFAYHLDMQKTAMIMASKRKAATFKQFDRGQDRYNNGFHGYRGPPRPLIGGAFIRIR